MEGTIKSMIDIFIYWKNYDTNCADFVLNKNERLKDKERDFGCVEQGKREKGGGGGGQAATAGGWSGCSSGRIGDRRR